MKTRKLEIVLVALALALFSWGLLRAAGRGDAVVKEWTTFVMSGLIVLAAYNFILRSRKIATAVLTISGVFLALALAAAGMSQAGEHPHPLPAVIRSVIFLALLCVTGWLQMRSPRLSADTGQPFSAANGGQARRR